jgi:hypothetical protein
MTSNKLAKNRQGQLMFRQFPESDWAGCKKTRKIMCCNFTHFSDILLVAQCHRQSASAEGSGEAVYITMCPASSGALHCKRLLSFVGIETEVILASDSSAARSFPLKQGASKKKPVHQKRTKKTPKQI